MSDIMNTFYDRSRNDVTTTQEPADTTTFDGERPGAVTTVDDTPEAAVAEETAPPADDDTVPTDVESGDDTEAGVAEDGETEDVAEDDVAEGDAEIIDADADSDDEADDSTGGVDEFDVIAADTVPVTLVPVAVEPGAAPAGSGDAPAVTETDDTETDDTETGPADADQPEPTLTVVPAAAVEARPAAGLRGTTSVGDGIVSKVVNLVAGKADGVHRLDDEESLVTVDGEIVEIRVALVVEYGHPVKALAERLRVDVIDAVEQLLGLDVAAVDVHVSDIHLPEAD